MQISGDDLWLFKGDALSLSLYNKGMKRIILGCIGAWMLNACAPVKQNETMENMYLIVGSYATPQEEGIKVYAWDNEKG